MHGKIRANVDDADGRHTLRVVCAKDTSLIEEGNQISKMIYALMQKVDQGNHLR